MSVPSVFVINSGSSSLKYQLLDPVHGRVLASGLVERIGEDEGMITHKAADRVEEVETTIADHEEALQRVFELFDSVGPKLADCNIIGVGHRVVQGGSYFSSPAVITPEVHKKIEELCDLAPLHNPAHLKGIDAAQHVWPDLTHVAVFDTSFFSTLPEKAYTYALDRETARKYQIRRYGAHGTSHQYVSSQVCDYLGSDNVRQITLHLGNGASACAELGRNAVETSMGLTPLEGLVMGTRTGDIDAAVVFHLARQGLSINEIDTIFNKRSGMKGLCGSNDMRSVWAEREGGNYQAAVAMEIYLHRLLKYVGSYTAVLGGLDVLSFTAGIGENDFRLRERLCAKLDWLGVELDSELNREKRDGIRVISTPDSAVKVMIVPTNEELAIARQVVNLI